MTDRGKLGLAAVVALGAVVVLLSFCVAVVGTLVRGDPVSATLSTVQAIDSRIPYSSQPVTDVVQEHVTAFEPSWTDENATSASLAPITDNGTMGIVLVDTESVHAYQASGTPLWPDVVYLNSVTFGTYSKLPSDLHGTAYLTEDRLGEHIIHRLSNGQKLDDYLFLFPRLDAQSDQTPAGSRVLKVFAAPDGTAHAIVSVSAAFNEGRGLASFNLSRIKSLENGINLIDPTAAQDWNFTTGFAPQNPTFDGARWLVSGCTTSNPGVFGNGAGTTSTHTDDFSLVGMGVRPDGTAEFVHNFTTQGCLDLVPFSNASSPHGVIALEGHDPKHYSGLSSIAVLNTTTGAVDEQQTDEANEGWTGWAVGTFDKTPHPLLFAGTTAGHIVVYDPQDNLIRKVPGWSEVLGFSNFTGSDERFLLVGHPNNATLALIDSNLSIRWSGPVPSYGGRASPQAQSRSLVTTSPAARFLIAGPGGVTAMKDISHDVALSVIAPAHPRTWAQAIFHNTVWVLASVVISSLVSAVILLGAITSQIYASRVRELTERVLTLLRRLFRRP